MGISRTIRRHRGLIAVGTLAVVAVVVYSAFQRTTTEETTVTYQTEQATLGAISVTVSGTGNLELGETTDVTPEIDGTVDEVLVAEGDAVTTGTVLFTLDADAAEAATTRAYASYLQAKQSVASAEAQLLRATTSLDELQDTYDAQQTAPAASEATQTAPVQEVTQDDIDLATADVSIAEANLAVSEANLSSAWDSYEDAKADEECLEVCAPCPGTVYSLDIESGDGVSASSGSTSDSASTGAAGSSSGGSSAPVVLVSEQPLVLHLTVNEIDLPTIELGQRADIEFDAISDFTATGKVYEIAKEGSNTQGVVTFDVWLSIDVTDARLRAGMSAAASIVTDFERDVLLVSNGGVKSDGNGGYYVEVLTDSAEEPERVTVTTGLTNATQTQIVDGLAEGDRVVTQTIEVGDDEESTSGSGFMMPGMGGGGPRG